MAYRLDRADFSSEAGARFLARSIAEYWRAKGCQVVVQIVPVAVHIGRVGRERETLWNVRTDLRAGLPPRAT